MSKNTIVAVVVTNNRISLLQECIMALQNQTLQCHIFVVDNASTDGTGEWLYEKKKEGLLDYVSLQENTGGAGGFSYGMKQAVANGYDYIWIMDDDTIPEKDALEKLYMAVSSDEKIGFIASKVLWTDNTECLMNRPLLLNNEIIEYNGLSMRPVRSATFVSLLFRADIIRKKGLPIAEYFIWGDDKEYTRRISKDYHCYQVDESVVIHKMKINAGSNITIDNKDRIARYFYAYRNDYVTARNEGISELLIYNVAFLLNELRIIFKSKDEKKLRIKTMREGRRAGKKFFPKIKFPE